MENIIKFGLVMAMVLAVASFFVFMIPVALRNFRQANEAGDESPGELDALRSEVDELRALAPRVTELEERLDFAERLLRANRPANDQLRDGSPERYG